MTGLRTALRIARRDAVRHKGRSLLVASLIALPVLAAVAGDIVIRSGIATDAEKVQAQLAGADAWIMAPEGVADFSQQWSFYGSPAVTGQGVITRDGRREIVPVTAFPARPAAEILPLLPAGSQLTPWRHVAAIPVKTPSGAYISAAADLLDITSPAAGDRYTVVSGSAPAGAGQLALTEHLAQRLDLQVGDTIVAGAPAHPSTVTAVVHAAATGESAVPPDRFDAVVGLPGTLSYVPDPFDGPRYLLTSPVPITLEMINTLNGDGIGVYSRTAALQMSAQASSDPNVPMFLALAGVSIGVVMALLQVVFLAGPAFAIGARRMRRQFGQLVANGATGRHLRTVVLAGGAVLGATGAIAGLLAGVGLGVALRWLFLAWIPDYQSVGVHLHAAELVGIAALGLGTALLAALAPAIRAGRATPLSLLNRQPSTVRPIKWWSLAGVILAATGIVVTVVMATGSVPEGAIGPSIRNRGIGLAIGAVVVEIGLLLAIPLLVRWLSRVGGRLPLSGRLALRDADRHRSRTAPGVAAVTAGCTLAMLAAVMYSSSGAGAQQHYLAGLPLGDVNVVFDQPNGDTAAGTAPLGSIDAAAARRVVHAQWPDARTVPYDVVDAGQHNDQVLTADGEVEGRFHQRGLIIPPENLCPYAELGTSTFQLVPQDPAIYTVNDNPPAPTSAHIGTAATDWRCYGRSYSTLTERDAHVHRWVSAVMGYQNVTVQLPTILVGGPDLRRELTGVADPAADAALAGGGAVAMDRVYLSLDGTISSGVVTGEQGPDGPVVGDTRSVPAVLGAWSPTPLGVILSPAAARALGWTPHLGGLTVDPGVAVDQAHADDLALALEAVTGTVARATLERGSMPRIGDSTRTAMTVLLIIIAFLIAGTIIVVTALGLADSRTDLATLAAVGAAPRIRRLVTGWTAGSMTLLGCLLGGVVGLVPAWGLLRTIQLVSAPYGDPIVVPWVALVPLLVAVPLVAFVVGTLLLRSKLPIPVRRE